MRLVVRSKSRASFSFGSTERPMPNSRMPAITRSTGMASLPGTVRRSTGMKSVVPAGLLPLMLRGIFTSSNPPIDSRQYLTGRHYIRWFMRMSTFFERMSSQSENVRFDTKALMSPLHFHWRSSVIDLEGKLLKRVQRYVTIEAVEGGTLTKVEAARGLGLSTRQVRRLQARVRAQGAAGLVHGNSGRHLTTRPRARSAIV